MSPAGGEGSGERYVRDVAYRSNFVAGQAPILLSYVAALAGHAPPDPARPFRYVELGCGSGTTLNALAAACPHGQFIGVDFNAQSIVTARSQAAAAGLGNVSYVESAFSALDARAIAPTDYIVCNGTYSWLDAREKSVLLALVQSSLREGGLLYLGYVTLGRAAITPMWHVLRRLRPDAGQDSLARLGAGIDLLAELRDAGAAYLQQNAEALTLVNEVQAQRRAGDTSALENLAHNLFAEDLKIELLDEICAALSPAGLGFCGSATPFLNDPDLALAPGLRGRHDALPSRVAQELLKDFMRATRVRADVFSRSPRDEAAAERYLASGVRAALVGERIETWRRLERPDWTSFGFVQPAVRFVFDRIADGGGSLAEVTSQAPFPPAAIRDAFCKLIASPGIELCLPDAGKATSGVPPVVAPACRYNELALDAARAGASTVQLAAPALGSCIPVTLPGSLLVAEFCRNGTAVPADAMHQRLRAHVAGMPGVSAAAAAQFADPQVFGQVRAAVLDRGLPMLLRFGAVVPG